MQSKLLKRKGMSVLTIILFIVLVLYVLTWAYSLLWALMTSVKTLDDWMDFNNPNVLPSSITLNNYVTVFKNMVFIVDVIGVEGYPEISAPEMLINSLIYVFGGSFVAVFSRFAVAYVTSKFDFKFNKVIMATVIIGLSLPIIGSLPSEIRMAKLLGIWNNIWGLCLMAGGYLGTNYLVFYATFKGIPKEYTEAAIVDGAGNVRIFFSIMTPLASGAFLTIFLMSCITFWNNYQAPLVYLPSYPTLAVGLYMFRFGGDIMYLEPPYETAGALMLALPIVIIFAVFSDRIMGKVSMGGIKE